MSEMTLREYLLQVHGTDFGASDAQLAEYEARAKGTPRNVSWCRIAADYVRLASQPPSRGRSV